MEGACLLRGCAYGGLKMCVQKCTVPPVGITGEAQCHAFLLQKVVALHTPLQKLKSGNSSGLQGKWFSYG